MTMNKYYLSLFLLFVTFGIKAQVETKYYSSGKNSELSKRVESWLTSKSLCLSVYH